MAISWLVPAALFGLVFIALPIAVHLLVRPQSRRVVFPSLRFLHPSHLSALRRRSVQDGVLLACRVLIFAAAAAALAAPVFVTPGRTASHARRIARAIVVQPGADSAIADNEAAGAFVSAVFSRARVGDAIADAMNWLDDRPPAAREIVVVAPFHLGQFTEADVAAIPAAMGIRLVAVESAPAPRQVEWPVLQLRGASLQRVIRIVDLRDDATAVVEGRASPVEGRPLAIVASPDDQPLADAALTAALTAGIPWPDGAPARMTLAWRGATPSSVAQAAREGKVVEMDVPSPISASASAVRRAVARAVEDRTPIQEPTRVSGEQLAQWQRSPGAWPSGAMPGDEGDRRWFWTAALVLLAVEAVMRRRRRPAGAVELDREARVA